MTGRRDSGFRGWKNARNDCRREGGQQRWTDGTGTSGRSVRRFIGRSRIGIQTLPTPWKGLLALRKVAVHSAEGSWIAALLGGRAHTHTIANAARLRAEGGWIRDALAVRGSGVAEVAGNTVRICFAVETVLTYLQWRGRSHCFIRWIRNGN